MLSLIEFRITAEPTPTQPEAGTPPASGEDKAAGEEKPGEEKPADQGTGAVGPENDYQLQRALDLLRGYALFSQRTQTE